ncbi:NUDIX domain-containing protein [Nocardia sp. NPDC052278]|uniref:NUDIX domain-containing protein n=1 Tax=unclassified Nocardia TaxID=2637762 RepID=UPI0036B81023
MGDGFSLNPVVQLRELFEGLPGPVRRPIEMVVFGGDLPRADIAKMRWLAAELRDKAAAMNDHVSDAGNLLAQQDSVGVFGDRLREALHSQQDGGAKLRERALVLADQTDGTANDAEKTLCVMFAFGIQLGWRIVRILSAAAAAGPAGEVAAAPVVESALMEGRAEVAVMRAGLEQAYTRLAVGTSAKLSALGPARFALTVGRGALLPTAVDGGVQLLQVEAGYRNASPIGDNGDNRTGIDVKSILAAAAAGAGGAAGGTLAARVGPTVVPRMQTSRTLAGLVHGTAGAVAGLGAASMITGWPEDFDHILAPMLNGAFAGTVHAQPGSHSSSGRAAESVVDGSGLFTRPDLPAAEPPVKISEESRQAWEAARQAWTATPDAVVTESQAPLAGVTVPPTPAPRQSGGSGAHPTEAASPVVAGTETAAPPKVPVDTPAHAAGDGHRMPAESPARSLTMPGQGPHAEAGAETAAPARGATGTPQHTAGQQPSAGEARGQTAERGTPPVVSGAETSQPPKVSVDTTGRSPAVPAAGQHPGGDESGRVAGQAPPRAEAGAENFAPQKVPAEAGEHAAGDGQEAAAANGRRSPGSDEQGSAAEQGTPAGETGQGAAVGETGAEAGPETGRAQVFGDDAGSPAPNSRDHAEDVLADFNARSGDHVPAALRLSNLPDEVLKAGLFHSDERESLIAGMEIIRRRTIGDAPGGMVLRPPQLEGGFEMARRPVQMLPGQGKTLMFMSYSMNQAVRHGSVLLVTTADGLAHREFTEYRRVVSDFGIDVLRADQATGFGPVTPGRPAIVVATGETVGHLCNAGHTPPRRVVIDEMDAIVDRGEKTFIRSEGAQEAAPEATAREVFAAHDFLAEALAKGQLSHEDFGLKRIAEEVDVELPDGTLAVGTEYWYDGRAELTPAGRAKLEALPDGNRWLQHMGPSRLEMAAAAEFTTRNKTHYVMDAGKIVIVDQGEHGLQRNPKTSSESRWSAEPGKASLAQAVEAKEIRAAEAIGMDAEQHGIVVRADADSAKSITAAEIYGTDRFFDHITGASGTLSDLGGVLKTVYGLDAPHEVDPFNPSRLVEGQADLHENTRGKLNALAGYAHQMWDGGQGRFQEILCHRNDLVEKQVRALLRAGVPREAIEAVDADRIAKWGADWETELQKVFDDAGEQGKILVINRQGQRGVDIAVSDAVLAKGGMHVWMTEVPEQSYIYDQAKNRTARNGKPGTAQALMSPQDALIRNAMHLRGVREAVIHYDQAVAAHRAAPTPETHNVVVEAGDKLGSLVPGLQQRAHHHATADFILRYAPITAPEALIAASTPWHPGDAEIGEPDQLAERSTRLARLLGIPAPALTTAAAAVLDYDDRDNAHNAATAATADPLHRLLHQAHLPPAAVETLRQHVDATAPAAAVQYALLTDGQALDQLTPRRDALAEELGLRPEQIEGAEGLRHVGAASTGAQHDLADALGVSPSDVTPAMARDILGEAVAHHLPDTSTQDHTTTDADTNDPAARNPVADDPVAENAVAAASYFLATAALLDLITQIHRRSPNSCVNNGVSAMRVLCPDNDDRFIMPPGGIPLRGHDWNTVRKSFGGTPTGFDSLDSAVESLKQRPGGIQVLVYKWKNTENDGSRDADNHLVILVNDSAPGDPPNLVVVDLAADDNGDIDFGPNDLADRRALLNKAAKFDTWQRTQQKFIERLPESQRAFWTIDFEPNGDLVREPAGHAVHRTETSLSPERIREIDEIGESVLADEAPRPPDDEDGPLARPSTIPANSPDRPNSARPAEPAFTGARPPEGAYPLDPASEHPPSTAPERPQQARTRQPVPRTLAAALDLVRSVDADPATSSDATRFVMKCYEEYRQRQQNSLYEVHKRGLEDREAMASELAAQEASRYVSQPAVRATIDRNAADHTLRLVRNIQVRAKRRRGSLPERLASLYRAGAGTHNAKALPWPQGAKSKKPDVVPERNIGSVAPDDAADGSRAGRGQRHTGQDGPDGSIGSRPPEDTPDSRPGKADPAALTDPAIPDPVHATREELAHWASRLSARGLRIFLAQTQTETSAHLAALHHGQPPALEEAIGAARVQTALAAEQWRRITDAGAGGSIIEADAVADAATVVFEIIGALHGAGTRSAPYADDLDVLTRFPEELAAVVELGAARFVDGSGWATLADDYLIAGRDGDWDQELVHSLRSLPAQAAEFAGALVGSDRTFGEVARRYIPNAYQAALYFLTRTHDTDRAIDRLRELDHAVAAAVDRLGHTRPAEAVGLSLFQLRIDIHEAIATASGASASEMRSSTLRGLGKIPLLPQMLSRIVGDLDDLAQHGSESPRPIRPSYTAHSIASEEPFTDDDYREAIPARFRPRVLGVHGGQFVAPNGTSLDPIGAEPGGISFVIDQWGRMLGESEHADIIHVLSAMGDAVAGWGVVYPDENGRPTGQVYPYALGGLADAMGTTQLRDVLARGGLDLTDAGFNNERRAGPLYGDLLPVSELFTMPKFGLQNSIEAIFAVYDDRFWVDPVRENMTRDADEVRVPLTLGPLRREPGHVEVVVYREGERTIVQYRDPDPGVEPDQVAPVFDELHQRMTRWVADSDGVEWHPNTAEVVHLFEQHLERSDQAPDQADDHIGSRPTDSIPEPGDPARHSSTVIPPGTSGQQVRAAVAGLLTDSDSVGATQPPELLNVAAQLVDYGLGAAARDSVLLRLSRTQGDGGFVVSGSLEGLTVVQSREILSDAWGGTVFGSFEWQGRADGANSSWSVRFWVDRKRVGQVDVAQLAELAEGFDAARVNSILAEAIGLAGRRRGGLRRGGALTVEARDGELRVRVLASVLPDYALRDSDVLFDRTISAAGPNRPGFIGSRPTESGAADERTAQMMRNRADIVEELRMVAARRGEEPPARGAEAAALNAWRRVQAEAVTIISTLTGTDPILAATHLNDVLNLLHRRLNALTRSQWAQLLDSAGKERLTGLGSWIGRGLILEDDLQRATTLAIEGTPDAALNTSNTDRGAQRRQELDDMFGRSTVAPGAAVEIGTQGRLSALDRLAAASDAATPTGRLLTALVDHQQSARLIQLTTMRVDLDRAIAEHVGRGETGDHDRPAGNIGTPWSRPPQNPSPEQTQPIEWRRFYPDATSENAPPDSRGNPPDRIGSRPPDGETPLPAGQPNDGDGPLGRPSTIPADPPEQPERPFRILDDPGMSGDREVEPGYWGHYGAAGVLVRHVNELGEELFLICSSKAGFSQGNWQLPGGALCSRETPPQGAAREMSEELGASAEYLARLAHVGTHVIHGPRGWKYHLLVADAPHRLDPVVDDKEIGEARWVSRNELIAMAHRGELHSALARNLPRALGLFELDADDQSEPAAPPLPDSTSAMPAEPERAGLKLAFRAPNRAMLDDYTQLYEFGRASFDDPSRTAEVARRNEEFFARYPQAREPAVQGHLVQYRALLQQIGDLADDLGVSVTELRAQLTSELTDLVAGKPLALRMRQEALFGLLADGRFKTQFEGTLGGGHRSDVAKMENRWFANPEDMDPRLRPVYGHVLIGGERPAGLSDASISAGLSDTHIRLHTEKLAMYGRIDLVLKDDVRERATFSVGDSLVYSGSVWGGKPARTIPSPLLDPQPESFGVAPLSANVTVEDQPLRGTNRDYSGQLFRRNQFVECHIHGGITLADIDHVNLPEPPDPELRAALENAGVPWRVLDSHAIARSGDPEAIARERRRLEEDLAVVEARVAGIRRELDTSERPDAPRQVREQSERVRIELRNAEAMRTRIIEMLAPLDGGRIGSRPDTEQDGPVGPQGFIGNRPDSHIGARPTDGHDEIPEGRAEGRTAEAGMPVLAGPIEVGEFGGVLADGYIGSRPGESTPRPGDPSRGESAVFAPDASGPQGFIGSRPPDESSPRDGASAGSEFPGPVLAGRESGTADRSLVEDAPGVRVEAVTFGNGTRVFAETYDEQNRPTPWSTARGEPGEPAIPSVSRDDYALGDGTTGPVGFIGSRPPEPGEPAGRAASAETSRTTPWSRLSDSDAHEDVGGVGETAELVATGAVESPAVSASWRVVEFLLEHFTRRDTIYWCQLNPDSLFAEWGWSSDEQLPALAPDVPLSCIDMVVYAAVATGALGREHVRAFYGWEDAEDFAERWVHELPGLLVPAGRQLLSDRDMGPRPRRGDVVMWFGTSEPGGDERLMHVAVADGKADRGAGSASVLSFGASCSWLPSQPRRGATKMSGVEFTTIADINNTMANWSHTVRVEFGPGPWTQAPAVAGELRVPPSRESQALRPFNKKSWRREFPDLADWMAGRSNAQRWAAAFDEWEQAEGAAGAPTRLVELVDVAVSSTRIEEVLRSPRRLPIDGHPQVAVQVDQDGNPIALTVASMGGHGRVLRKLFTERPDLLDSMPRHGGRLPIVYDDVQLRTGGEVRSQNLEPEDADRSRKAIPGRLLHEYLRLSSAGALDKAKTKLGKSPKRPSFEQWVAALPPSVFKGPDDFSYAKTSMGHILTDHAVEEACRPPRADEPDDPHGAMAALRRIVLEDPAGAVRPAPISEQPAQLTERSGEVLDLGVESARVTVGKDASGRWRLLVQRYTPVYPGEVLTQWCAPLHAGSRRRVLSLIQRQLSGRAIDSPASPDAGSDG